MKPISHTRLILLGIAGIIAFVLVPTISRALGISDTGAAANAIFFVQAAAGFAGLIALVLGLRHAISRRHTGTAPRPGDRGLR